MSEFKEKVLSEISFAMVDDAPDLQKLYDKVAATDEHSELNDNQKIVLEWLKKQRIQENGLILPPIEILSNLTNYIYVSSANDKVFKSFVSLSEPEQFEVLTAFAQWGLKQEEAG
ncbi:hypothetical protein PNC89_04150 [Enterococcus faecium]|uniref:hypothetical protein n=1 Tax=Enterococcus TaxID=1350 RepID=UPI0008A8DDDF|nr:hypothetical protein [Enterococcus sp. HMSC072F02]MDB7280640.1 hypothetical protein [Enterococcus faecium]MDB7283283.1 hypothetical protein [Enterococcus faecium]MDB7288367.1 hypothetical protein [Enterococcus faecium]MDB7293452.1 hypothetical protein [Enterococcus faecium]MDB7303443.1 hypothetical protein [Enterococcus faecium]